MARRTNNTNRRRRSATYTPEALSGTAIAAPHDHPEIVDLIPTSTDELDEGVSNLYYTDERAQDAAAAALVAGTHSGASVTYDDAGNKINITVSASGASGTAFPGSPMSGQRFFRTDLGLDCYFDGTRWLTVQEYEFGSGINEGSNSFNSTSPIITWRGAVRSDYGIYLTRWVSTSRVNTTNSGSAYWTMELYRQSSSTVGTVVASYTTAADAPTTIVHHDQAINAILDASAVNLFVQGTKTGAPGVMHVISALYYRLVVT